MTINAADLDRGQFCTLTDGINLNCQMPLRRYRHSAASMSTLAELLDSDEATNPQIEAKSSQKASLNAVVSSSTGRR